MEDHSARKVGYERVHSKLAPFFTLNILLRCKPKDFVRSTEIESCDQNTMQPRCVKVKGKIYGHHY